MQDLKMANKTQEVILKYSDTHKIEMVFTCDDAVFLQNNIYQAIKTQSVFLWEFLAHDKNILQMIISFSSPKRSNNCQIVAQFLSNVDFGNESITNKINIYMLSEIFPPIEIQKTIYSGLRGSDLISLACVNKSRNKFFNDLITSEDKNYAQIKKLYLEEIKHNKLKQVNNKKYFQELSKIDFYSTLNIYGAIFIKNPKSIKQTLSELGFLYERIRLGVHIYKKSISEKIKYFLHVASEINLDNPPLFKKIKFCQIFMNENSNFPAELAPSIERYFDKNYKTQIVSSKMLTDDEKEYFGAMSVSYKESDDTSEEIATFVVNGITLELDAYRQRNLDEVSKMINKAVSVEGSLEICFLSLITIISQNLKTDYISHSFSDK